VELLSQIPIFGGFISMMVAFVGVLAVVVFVHEYGHYIVGRWCGIFAETFSLGFGPVIWSRVDKHGTKWQLALIPLGGYVKFLGDRSAASEPDDEAMAMMSASDRDRSFPAAKIYKRALTVFAGPVANFILAAVIFTGLVMSQGVATKDLAVGEMLAFPSGTYDLQTGDVILSVEGQAVSGYDDVFEISQNMETPHDMTMVVLRDGQELTVNAPYFFPAAVFGIEPLSAAGAAGLEKGDIILKVNDSEVFSFNGLKEIVEVSGDIELLMLIWRDGKTLDVAITPVLKEYPNNDGGFDKRVMIGISSFPAFLPATETPSLWRASKIGVTRVWDVMASSLNGLKHIVLQNLSAKNLQGPIGIAQMSKATANQGVVVFLSFVAMISTGIGMLNLFPIPMLDGGHLVFYAIEAVRGRPLANKTIQVLVSIGLVMVLLLMVFVTYNDLLRM